MGQLHCHDLNKQCCCSEQDILPSYSIPGIENRKFGKIRLYWHAYYILFYYTLQILRFFFYKLKVCWNPALSKSISASFPTALVHFVSLCHILVIFTILQTLHQQNDCDLLKVQMMVGCCCCCCC